MENCAVGASKDNLKNLPFLCCFTT